MQVSPTLWFIHLGASTWSATVWTFPRQVGPGREVAVGRLWCRAQNRKRLLAPLFSGFLYGQLIQLPVNWVFVPSCPGRKRSHHPRQQSWPREPRTCTGALSPALLLYRALPELPRQENGKKAQRAQSILRATDKAPAGGQGGGGGGGLRKGVRQGT